MTRRPWALALFLPAVLAAGGSRADRSPIAGPASAPPRVYAMIVGRTATLGGVRTVVAGRTAVRASGRSCGVEAGTPLAVLADYDGGHGPGVSTRDYGSCTRDPANSAALFVYRVGPDRNRGQDGWAYKVDGRIGSTGAADPSGPFGTGHRLHDRDHVLWFWCHMGRHGCQRSLLVRGPRSAARRSRVRTLVEGLDDQGRRASVSGALVTLGPSRARTAADGSASFDAPSRPGHYWLTATRRGRVVAFPLYVTVR